MWALSVAGLVSSLSMAGGVKHLSWGHDPCDDDADSADGIVDYVSGNSSRPVGGRSLAEVIVPTSAGGNASGALVYIQHYGVQSLSKSELEVRAPCASACRDV